MHEVLIDGIIHQMTDTRKKQLADSSAIIRSGDMEWVLSAGPFSHQQTLWLLSLGDSS